MPIDPLNVPAVIGEAVAGQAAKNVQRAAAVKIELEHLNDIVQDATFDVAELLAEVKANHYYGGWGYESLDEYAEIVLGMKKRKVYYLISIVTQAKELGIPRADYEDIQITKLREISTLKAFDSEGKPLHSPTTGEPIGKHVHELLELAKTAPLTKIAEEVARIKGETGENEMVFLHFKVTKSCRDGVIRPAQELARKMHGTAATDAEGDPVEYSDSICEEAIHSAYLLDPNNVDVPGEPVVESEDDETFAERQEEEAEEKKDFLEAHEEFLKECRPGQTNKGTKI